MRKQRGHCMQAVPIRFSDRGLQFVDEVLNLLGHPGGSSSTSRVGNRTDRRTDQDHDADQVRSAAHPLDRACRRQGLPCGGTRPRTGAFLPLRLGRSGRCQPSANRAGDLVFVAFAWVWKPLMGTIRDWQQRPRPGSGAGPDWGIWSEDAARWLDVILSSEREAAGLALMLRSGAEVVPASSSGAEK